MSVFSKRSLLFWGSFFLPLILLCIIGTKLGLTPLGNNNLLVSDLGTQYVPFLSSFKHFFQGGAPALYSFSDALGDGIIPLWAYYLISPFNFLTLFFSYAQLPTVAGLIIVLKISSMGLSMFYYLDTRYKKVSIFTLLFSTSYSFCGFVTIYCLNFMWLDSLILFPLLVLGLEKLFYFKKYWLYCVTLFLTIITNYYMGYMVCIFSVCYILYLYYLHSTHYFSITNFFEKTKLFFLSSLLTGLSTSFLLLPAIEGMLQTGKTEFNLANFMPYPKFFLGFFYQFGIASLNFELRLNHLPAVFSGIFITIFFLAFFRIKTIARKEKKAACLLLGLIFISFWIETLNTVWHMFQSPAGFPYRNTFIFSFLLIVFAYDAFLKIYEGEPLDIFVPIIFSVLLVAGQLSLKMAKFYPFVQTYKGLLLSLCFIWVIYFLFHLNKKMIVEKLFIPCLVIIVCLELSVNFWFSFKNISFGNQHAFEQTVQVQEALIDAINAQDTTFFRIKQTINRLSSGYAEKNNGYNNAFLYNYSGISSYTSTLNSKTQETLKDLGLYQKNARRIGYVDSSQVVNLLLNNRYTIKSDQKTTRDEHIIGEYGDYATIKHPEAIGMGFSVPDAFINFSLKHNQPLQNQENILQEILPSTAPYFKNPATIQTTWSDDRLTIHLSTSSEGQLYFYVPKLKYSTVKEFYVNKKLITPDIPIKTNQLFQLGYFKKGDFVEINIRTKSKKPFENIQIQTLDHQLFNTLIKQKKEDAVEFTRHSDSFLEGTITNHSENNWLYLAIPYDKNWKITINNQHVTQKKVVTNLTAIPLTKGSNHIEFHYHSRIVQLSTFFSMSIFISTGVYQLLQSIRKKKGF